jgi:hypothetical protein
MYPLLSLYNSFIIGELVVFALLFFSWAALALKRRIKRLCRARPLV